MKSYIFRAANLFKICMKVMHYKEYMKKLIKIAKILRKEIVPTV
jgi:hypothetical protein